MYNETFTLTEEPSFGGGCRIVAKGRFNAASEKPLREKLENAIRANKDTVLNMSEVLYLSSAGIRVLLSVYKQAKKAGLSFRVSNPSENVKNVLGMTALDELLL